MKKSSEPSSKTNINKSLCQFSNIDLSKEELIIMFKAIYDEDLISHINKLSSNIKQFYLEHESIFTRIYNQIKQTTQPELVESIKQLDQCFEEFYGNAKIIFKITFKNMQKMVNKLGKTTISNACKNSLDI